MTFFIVNIKTWVQENPKNWTVNVLVKGKLESLGPQHLEDALENGYEKSLRKLTVDVQINGRLESLAP